VVYITALEAFGQPRNRTRRGHSLFEMQEEESVGIDSETLLRRGGDAHAVAGARVAGGEGPDRRSSQTAQSGALTPLPDEIRHALETFGGGVTPKD
jgi:hypothetical protein